MDVFTTVVGIVVAGIALFIGYRVGVKDGFRGGFQSGRTLERQLAVEQRRYLSSRVVREEAMLQPAVEQKALPPRIRAIHQELDETQELVAIRPGDEAGLRYDSYEGNRF